MKKIILLATTALLALTASAQKIASVNYTELVQLVPEADAAREQLSAQSNEFEQTYTDMLEEYQSKYTQYQQKASTWTAAIKESKEKELNDIGNRLQEFQQTAQQELSMSQQQLMAPIQQKVSETIDNLARTGGYALVFDVSQYVYADPSQVTDITPAARKALNIPDGRTLETLQAELQAQAEAQ